MKNFLKKYNLLLIFIIFIIYGVNISIEKYYYSTYQFVYWIFCGILIILFFSSKIYTQSIKRNQAAALIPITLLYFFSWLIITHFLRFGIFLFSTFCFLYAGTILYNSRNKILKTLFIIAFSISSINLLVILFFISERSWLTRTLLETLFITNSAESEAYFISKLSYLHFIIFALFIASVLVLFLGKKKELIQSKINIQTFFLFALAFSLSSFSGPLGALSTEYVIFLKNQEALNEMVANRAKGLSEIHFTIDTSKNKAKKVMIIIGESTNRQYMSLYGYPENTTPNLLKLAAHSDKGKLFIFDDVISAETATVQSLKKVLTDINNTNNIPFEKSVSIVDLFKRAGYESFWISNQLRWGKYDTPNAVISASTDHQFFTQSNNNIKNDNAATGNYYDGDMFKSFSSYAAKPSLHKNQLYFIHLMGTHWFYNDRYPPAYNVFKTAIIGDKKSYLNAVLYNDYVVTNFIKLAEENKFDVVCYFSDHAEDMKYQHNPENYTPEMVTIPLMVYLSNNYIKNHPKLVAQLEKNKDTPGMTDNFFNDIQTISGFTSSLYNAQESFISDSYIRTQRKVIDNTTPYHK